jgi:hypothetical protein
MTPVDLLLAATRLSQRFSFRDRDEKEKFQFFQQVTRTCSIIECELVHVRQASRVSI